MTLTAYPGGDVTSCCFAPDAPLGSMKTSSLAEIWNGERMRGLRLRMLQDRPSEQCWRCYQRESIGGYSKRLEFNRGYRHHLPLVEATGADGAVPRMNMVYLDFRFSNQCNFACRTCDAWTSSAWYDDAIALGDVPVPATRVVRPGRDPEDTWRQLEPLLDQVETVYFAGGEPLLTPEHYRVLIRLIETGRTHVRLRYSTNFSVLTFGSHDVMALWRRFADVCVQASIDGTGARGEYLRKGMRWPAVLVNRERLEALCPHVGFEIVATVCALNALHLPDLHRECVEGGLIGPGQLALNLLVDPDFLRVQVLPPRLKDELRARIDRHLAEFVDPFGEAGRSARAGFEATLRFLHEQDLSHRLPALRDFSRRLDAIRGESLAEVLPELRELVA